MQLAAGDHSYDSGDLEFELHAGHRYAFGIHLDRGCCYDITGPGSDLLSFGKVIGASFGGGGDYHDTNELFPTTANSLQCASPRRPSSKRTASSKLRDAHLRARPLPKAKFLVWGQRARRA